MTSNPKIQAVIFDMDGLLIDSEYLWQQAVISVLNKAGIPVNTELVKQTSGLKANELVEYWLAKYPNVHAYPRCLSDAINDQAAHLIARSAVAKEGAFELITLCKQLQISMAIASSSPEKVIRIVIDKFHLRGKIDVFHSGEHEELGKPHPAVYLSAAKKLHVDPQYCLAFEDSINGVIAAKAARMKCIAVPEKHMREDGRYQIADRVVYSLSEIVQTDLPNFLSL